MIISMETLRERDAFNDAIVRLLKSAKIRVVDDTNVMTFRFDLPKIQRDPRTDPQPGDVIQAELDPDSMPGSSVCPLTVHARIGNLVAFSAWDYEVLWRHISQWAQVGSGVTGWKVIQYAENV